MRGKCIVICKILESAPSNHIMGEREAFCNGVFLIIHQVKSWNILSLVACPVVVVDATKEFPLELEKDDEDTDLICYPSQIVIHQVEIFTEDSTIEMKTCNLTDLLQAIHCSSSAKAVLDLPFIKHFI